MYKTLYIVFIFFLIFKIGFSDLQNDIDSLRTELESNRDDYLLHFKLAGCYYALEDYPNALEEFSRVLELNPEYYPAEFKIALIYFYQDSLSTALQRFEQLRTEHPEKKDIYLWLSNLYGLHGEYEQMLVLLNEYQQLADKAFFKSYTNRDYYNIASSFAKAYALLGNTEEAIKYYHKSIDYYDIDVEDELDIAMCYKRMNRDADVEKYLKKAMSHYKEYYELYYNGNELYNPQRILSIYYWLVGEYDKALEMIDSLDTYKALTPIDKYNRCIFNIAKGQTDALDDILKICETDTSQFVQAMYNALTAIIVDSLIQAEIYLRQDIPGLRRSGVAKALHAWVLESLGKEDEAKKFWFRCYCDIPLGVDVESMRSFITEFIEMVKNESGSIE